ncbi:hypothetical protein L6452_31902 [Arctium lappa]|uniref:Uncharacterized protein n=1 Tax=Arctium lappa TaxID=4217 RepID=A0ACB8Z3G2_ARCLA|nr:hypothetical protein L6452_31902 [Arctium lappa]
MVKRPFSYVLDLYKIFDEIFVNVADNKQRDPKMDSVKVTIDVDKNLISVYNNGDGIPVEIHKEEQIFVPELIFGHLLIGSNCDDYIKKTTGGRNSRMEIEIDRFQAFSLSFLAVRLKVGCRAPGK